MSNRHISCLNTWHVWCMICLCIWHVWYRRCLWYVWYRHDISMCISMYMICLTCDISIYTYHIHRYIHRYIMSMSDISMCMICLTCLVYDMCDVDSVSAAVFSLDISCTNIIHHIRYISHIMSNSWHVWCMTCLNYTLSQPLCAERARLCLV